jgi:hypothetical protein
MEIVNIKRLKATLQQGELPARETAKYAAAQGALLSLAFIPSPAPEPVDWGFVAFPLLTLAGVFYCYRRNGGDTGTRFAERYLAIGWVIGWRVALVLGALLVVSVAGSLLATGKVQWLENPRLADAMTAATLATMALIYWRMGHHMAQVHTHRPPIANE